LSRDNKPTADLAAGKAGFSLPPKAVTAIDPGFAMIPAVNGPMAGGGKGE
jgi:hypothetical protein